MSVERWVADELHGLVGYSDRTVAEFILAAARKSASPSQLLASLLSTGTLEKNRWAQHNSTAFALVRPAATGDPQSARFVYLVQLHRELCACLVGAPSAAQFRHRESPAPPGLLPWGLQPRRTAWGHWRTPDAAACFHPSALQSAAALNRQREAEAKALQARNASYAVLEENEEEALGSPTEADRKVSLRRWTASRPLSAVLLGCSPCVALMGREGSFWGCRAPLGRQAQAAPSETRCPSLG
jgi:hypothetical protein